MRIIRQDQFNALRIKATEGGASGPWYALRWDLAGRCSNPYVLRYQCSRTITEGTLDLVTRCRECQHCLRLRAWQWAARAGHEYADAERTWFVTLTLGPEMRAILRHGIKGLDQPNLIRASFVKRSGEEVGRYFKRLRKRTGLKIRYMAVPELHKDGMVHWHCLIHGPNSLSWRALSGPWKPNGFSKMNLVHPDSAVRNIRYATKYLAKAKLGRVRASVSYGRNGLGHRQMICRENPCETQDTRSKEIDQWIEQIAILLKEHGYELS